MIIIETLSCMVDMDCQLILNELDFIIGQDKKSLKIYVSLQARRYSICDSQYKLAEIKCHEDVLQPRARLDMSYRTSNDDYPRHINFKECSCS